MAFEVAVSAGLATVPGDGAVSAITVQMPNPRAIDTSFRSAFTGGHLLHLAVASCILNDIYREAEKIDLQLDSVTVTASGGFGGDPVVSTGITYWVHIESPENRADIDRLVAYVDEIAEVPNTLKGSTSVVRVPSP